MRKTLLLLILTIAVLCGGCCADEDRHKGIVVDTQVHMIPIVMSTGKTTSVVIVPQFYADVEYDGKIHNIAGAYDVGDTATVCVCEHKDGIHEKY